MRDRIAADTAGPEGACLKQTLSLAPWTIAEFHFITPADLMTDSDVVGRPHAQGRAMRSLFQHCAKPTNSFGEEKEFFTLKMQSHRSIGEMKFSTFA